MHPILFRNEYLIIPTYLFLISLSFSIGVFWVSRRAQALSMDHKLALDLCLVFMIGSLVGARLLHVIYERPDIYFKEPLRIFEIWRGGFVYYGGAAMATLLTYALLRQKKQAFLPWGDLFAPVLSFGYALGRLGCFFGGCCYGRECELPWAVVFPEGVEAPAGIPIHPTQIYASLWEMVVLGLLLVLERRQPTRQAGHLFFLWLILHSLGRIVMETFRADYRGDEIAGLSVSTVLSVILFMIGLVGTMRIRKAKHASRTL